MTPETVSLYGPWNLCGFTHGLRDIQIKLRVLANSAELQWDLRAIDSLDRIGALLLWQAWDNRRPHHLRLRAEHESLFRNLQQIELLPIASHWRISKINRLLARRVLALISHGYSGLTMLGQLVLDTGYIIRHPDRFPWREVSATIRSAGAQALAITALVGLLIGVVISYLLALQLEIYGAQGYIVDVLGMTVIRELGPMLAAILVAGRSGSAMTAELGVMRVTHELDALAALGVSHTVRLVLPKVIALIIVLPLLVVWTDAIALLGGMIAAQLTLGLDYQQLILGLPAAVPVINFWIGLAKGVVFGALIALTACHFGLRIQSNTQSLAAETTNAVVTSITLLILVDAVFAILFEDIGFS
ncbi:MAG: ABC transporter permease [Pseudomonadota bacterium]